MYPPPPRSHKAPSQRSASLSFPNTNPNPASHSVPMVRHGSMQYLSHNPNQIQNYNHQIHNGQPFIAAPPTYHAPPEANIAPSQISPQKRISFNGTRGGGGSSAIRTPAIVTGAAGSSSQRRTSAIASETVSLSPGGGGEAPAVLVRDKKQKACANCRRAKLKCIVNDGKVECVRCTARKEKCVFYPRSHDEEWQQTITADVYGAINHLSHLDAAVRHLLFHLTARGLIPPFETEGLPAGLPVYEPVERDMDILQGWTGSKEKDSPEKKKCKRKDREEEEESTTPQRNVQPLPLPPAPALVPVTALAPLNTQFWQRPLPIPVPIPMPISNPHPIPQSPIIAYSPQMVSPLSHFSPIPFVPTTPEQFAQLALTAGTIGENPPEYDIEGEVIIGSSDTRPNIIKEGIVKAEIARQLVTFFHSNMAPFLFGYQLKFGCFPYHPRGPATMTPLILGVTSLLASERMSVLSPDDHQRLAKDVLTEIARSPARSWITFDALKQAKSDHTSNNTDNGGDDEWLNPEFGIGPEEIVGTCILASYMGVQFNDTSRERIAASAFKWARGWIKVLQGGPRDTYAARLGIVPAEREASEEDKARVWLLGYIVDGLESVRSRDPPTGEEPYDPSHYCQVLVPLIIPPNTRLGTHDILLTYRAQLVSLLRKHRWTRHQLANNASPTPEGSQRHIDARKHLAFTTNAQLQWWSQSLATHNLPQKESRQLHCFYLFSRIVVNNDLVLLDETTDGPLRKASIEIAVNAAVEFLQLTALWDNSELASLPGFELYILTSISTFLGQAARGTNDYACRNGSEEGSKQLISLGDAISLIASLSERFGLIVPLGGLAFDNTYDVLTRSLQGLRAACG